MGRSRSMGLGDSSSPSRGFDFTPVLFAIVLAFVVAGSLQFSRSLAGGERGLLLFERACPIHSSAL
ncbi:MAG: hypothetical protein WAM02_00305 [Candidatus Cybelea sp.]